MNGNYKESIFDIRCYYLIDFLKCDRTIIKLVSTNVGQVYLATPVLVEISEINTEIFLPRLAKKSDRLQVFALNHLYNSLHDLSAATGYVVRSYTLLYLHAHRSLHKSNKVLNHWRLGYDLL